MKPSLGILSVMALLCVSPCVAHADNGDLDFSCVAKRVDEKTTTSGTGTAENKITIDTEDWQYVVTLQNNTFNDFSNLEIRYLIFTKKEEMGTVAGARFGKQFGTVKIDVIKGHDKVEFKTDVVKLQKASLSPGSYYNNGARTEGEANLAGLWIRIYQNGNLIAEMSRPPNLATKEKWGE